MQHCSGLNVYTDLLCHGAVMFVCVFSGHDSEYGLESEEVILTPEDENPLRRILQVHTLYFPCTNSTVFYCIATHINTHWHTNTQVLILFAPHISTFYLNTLQTNNFIVDVIATYMSCKIVLD